MVGELEPLGTAELVDKLEKALLGEPKGKMNTTLTLPIE